MGSQKVGARLRGVACTRQRRIRLGGWIVTLACLFLTACGGGAAQQIPATSYTPVAGAIPSFSHVFVLVMENRSYDEVIGNSSAPYINSLAKTYGLATQYYGITHPSLPNYLALTGGSTFGITSDCTSCFVQGNNLAQTLTAGHKTWKAYMEGMPSPCFVGDAYPYAQKHNPFIYYDSIRTDPTQCGNIVPYTQLASDLQANTVPDVAWITPNLCHDMHDCSTATGDSWLSGAIPSILASPAWQQGGVLFLTWDEADADNSGCCTYAHGGRIVTLVISPLGKQHYASATPYDHYSLLRTICASWGLSAPGDASASATPAMTDFFTHGG